MLAIFLDQETTGLDPIKHNVVEIALRIYQVEADIEIASYETVVKLSEENWSHRNRTSVEVNGFTYEETNDIAQLFGFLFGSRGKRITATHGVEKWFLF